ncbi:KdsC family phosphatase [Salinibacter ruber]|uniref:KdsC family phosphatase n=1 Tax=Salinibacter ruber TaxID=146919 RepID=UPI002168E7B6|nr:hypothetical protein [Salinibacter ruber]MCS4150718.1 YrbI family 3-deoxy-D-manno-octulosonate 8-phosphate phosphatase [Salinibacter ruber]
MQDFDIIVTDVDGVLTDGGMYCNKNGVTLKKFSVYDGGAPALAKYTCVDIVVLSGENSNLTKKRCEKIGIQDVRTGIQNKSAELAKIMKTYNTKPKNILVVVDFINDLNIIREYASACPSSAPPIIKKESDYVIDKDAGTGVLWRVTKRVLKHTGEFDVALQEYLKSRKR